MSYRFFRRGWNFARRAESHLFLLTTLAIWAILKRTPFVFEKRDWLSFPTEVEPALNPTTASRVNLLTQFLELCVAVRNQDEPRASLQLQGLSGRIRTDWIYRLLISRALAYSPLDISLAIAVADRLENSSIHRVTSRGSREVVYIAHNSLPISSGGYAIRTHAIAKSLSRLGVKVSVLTRPGYPRDVSGLEGQPVANMVVDDVAYARIANPQRKSRMPSSYVLMASKRIEAQLMKQRPSLVIAASNYLTGLPALIASKRLGIPFAYEVRGLWEITRLSRDPDFEQSHEFGNISAAEAFVARNADFCLAISSQVADTLAARGVPREKFFILPNGWSPEYKSVQPPEEEPTKGSELNLVYGGTIVDYEGLEVALLAIRRATDLGASIRLDIAGSGSANAVAGAHSGYEEKLHNLAKSLRLDEHVNFLGRLDRRALPTLYSTKSAMIIPRVSLPVTEIVGPIKPYEAMAVGVPLICSDVAPLRELVESSTAGILFRAGDVEDFAKKLLWASRNTDSLRNAGLRGREWLARERDWDYLVSQTYGEILDKID